MDSTAEASAAYEALNPRRRKRTRKVAPVELPKELESALKSIPSGYKLGFGADGKPRLVKTRVRTKKA